MTLDAVPRRAIQPPRSHKTPQLGVLLLGHLSDQFPTGILQDLVQIRSIAQQPAVDQRGDPDRAADHTSVLCDASWVSILGQVCEQASYISHENNGSQDRVQQPCSRWIIGQGLMVRIVIRQEVFGKRVQSHLAGRNFEIVLHSINNPAILWLNCARYRALPHYLCIYYLSFVSFLNEL